MNTLNSIKKGIGNYSSVNETLHNDSHVEYYIREEGENKTMTDKTTTEPDPTGDIAVTKAANSDLARRKITKAISRLEKALKNLPDTNRAASVSVSNETAPVAKVDGDLEKAVVNLDGNPTKAAKQVNKAMRSLEKAITGLPNVSRAASVSVSNETAPIAKADGDAKQQGTDKPVNGDGANSEQANGTTDTDAKPMTKASNCGPDCTGDDCSKCAAMGITKASCCADCGDDCSTSKQCCMKCMKMNKDIAGNEEITIAKADDDSDAGSEPDDDSDDKVQKSAQDLINDAKLTKSIWGGAFGSPNIPNMR
jgi:hypothetical protein